ncbi:hypothetical protein PHAVU_001G118400 [Phaseolus vulgaris]|uniref:Uncharacterized protein n=1 Tax=Phaseolus vulgaris TaxID=3885 RepID=V7CYP9_PHAVU|nr:hypothetical protein PHAVU_001G118400g [Phaseolus vulgaris]ESW34031.1 hypothetical protein PHAVU_001G118400g [Phaseolus vulgaris]
MFGRCLAFGSHIPRSKASRFSWEVLLQQILQHIPSCKISKHENLLAFRILESTWTNAMSTYKYRLF